MKNSPARKTARGVYKEVDEIISYCQENDKMLSDFLLTEKLGISQKELDGWYDDYFSGRTEETGVYKKVGYDDVVKKIIAYREHFLLQSGLDCSKTASIANFALRQRKNGGYQEKQAADGGGEMKITVRLGGAGQEPFG